MPVFYYIPYYHLRKAKKYYGISALLKMDGLHAILIKQMFCLPALDRKKIQKGVHTKWNGKSCM